KLNKTQFGGAEENSFFLSEKLAKDLMDESEVLKELKSKKSNSKDDLQFMKEVCESLKDRGYLFSKKISNYTFTKKALEKLGRGFNKNTQIDEKSVHQFRESKGKPFMSLNNPLQKKSALKNTFQLLNDVMDVQDALFGAGITLQDLYVNNILKSNFRKLQLENDYEKLQVVIENLKNEGLLKDVDSSSGILCLTPEAIDFLLNYSISILNFKENLIHKGSKKKCLDAEKVDIKKFSLGDFYRNLSVQHTLKGLARKRKLLKDIERKDLRFFIKKPKQGLDVVLAIDASGSMAQDSKFKLAKLIAAGLIKIILDRGGKIALTAFNDLSETLTSYTDEKNLLFENLIKLRASRNTNIGEGIKSSLRLSLKNGLEKGEKRIILITDGEPTATSKNALKDLKFSENSVLGEAYAIQEARRAKKYGVTVSVIAISKKNSRKGLIFAEKLARTGGGVFYKIEDMKDLDNIIRCEFLRLNKSK
ncbi:MAG: VWA domain-containing protein, partial [Nitrososphaerales archaeon]